MVVGWLGSVVKGGGISSNLVTYWVLGGQGGAQREKKTLNQHQMAMCYSVTYVVLSV